MYAQNEEILFEDKQAKRPLISTIYKTYENRCRKAGAMDFDDLLFQTHVLLRDFPEVLAYYQHKFQFILVDEYQDTNYAQYLIVKKLAATNENICVVGDDAQSIYSFRGANIQNILNFKVDYPDFKLFKLEQNYRSTKNIVEAANSIISKNKDQIKKTVWTDNNDGAKITVIRTLTDNEEGKIIAGKIFDTKQSLPISFNDIAVLYRTNRQSRAFEEALRKFNIPYKIYGGISFYQRKEIKDLLAYFRLTTNPSDEEALKRILNYPRRGIGKTTEENLIIAANQNSVSIWEVLLNLDQYGLNFNKGVRDKLYEFVTMIRSFQAQLHSLNAFQLAETIAKSSGIIKELKAEKDKGPEEVERFQNIEELLSGIQEFVNSSDEIKTLSDFLLDVALLTDADQDKNEERNHVTLMTIHSSKGLEFPNVFIVGMEENLFPSQMALNSRTELEEERRLFYVALTRAKDSCTLSYAASRFTWGQLISSEPSRFIDEIDSQFLHFDSPPRGQGRSLGMGINRTERPFTGGLNRSMGSPKLTSMNELKGTSNIGGNSTYMVGQNVQHEKFGKGKITKLEGVGNDQKATVFFPHHGIKNLIVRFANLQILEED
jgi:DNA helicase-2/ATP-dependent DNA helicase PcrA